MKFGIVILACRRPKYLYVTLSSLYRIDLIADCYVSILIDYIQDFDIKNLTGEIVEDIGIKRELLSLVSAFPIDRLEFRKRNTRLLNSFQYGIRSIFDTQPVDVVLLIQDDVIVHPKALSWYYWSPKNVFSHTLWREEIDEADRYYEGLVMRGMFLTRNSFMALESWLNSNQYWGLQWSWTDQKFYQSGLDAFITLDGPIDALGREKHLISLMPPRSLMAHFGVTRSLCGPDRLVTQSDIDTMEQRMFSGMPGEWLNNILQILSLGDYDTKFDHILFPRGFPYAT